MTKKICINFVCVMLLCVMCVVVFAACGGKNYKYADFQEAYAVYVSNNSLSESNVNTIFDVNGSVSVNYSNSKLLNAIKSTSVEDYKLMYTRLSSDTDSSQAIFAPALKASMMMLNKYVSVTPEKAVPTDRVNELMNKLSTLNNKTNTFTFSLIKFQTRGDDFDKNNGIDKSFLKHLLDSYYDMLVASCDLSIDFADVANKYFWSDTADSSTGRIAPGKIERYYLTQMTSLVDTYARFDLVTFYSQAYIIDGVEYYTNQNPAYGINNMLSRFEANRESLVAFENKYNAGEMSTNERTLVQSYYDAVSYDTPYQAAYNIASRSLDRMGDKTSDLDAKFNASSASQAHRKVVSNFVQNEFHNKINTMLNLMDCVQNLV